MKKVILAAAALVSLAAFAKPGDAGLNRDFWTGIKRTQTPALKIAAKVKPNGSDVVKSSAIKAPANANYCQRIYGIITIPADGQYVFCISADDNAELKLSTTGNAKDLKTVASCPTWVNYKVYNKNPKQKSAPIALKKGQKCYIQVDMTQDKGGHHCSFAWIMPGAKAPADIPVSAMTTVK